MHQETRIDEERAAAPLRTRFATPPVTNVLARVSPWAVDSAIALVLFGVGLFQLVEGPRPGAGGLSTPTSHVALLGLAALSLVPRSRWPLATLAGVVLFGAPYWVADPRQLALLPIVLVGLYGVVANSSLSRVQAWALAVAAGLLLALALVSGGRPGVDPIQSAILMSLGGAVLLGDATRSRRALVLEAESRAAEAERSREEHALRRVSEERLEIARELHDVVAHNIALINVQAGVSAHLRERDPERVQEAFEQIKRVSHATLEEMRSLVGVLREPVEGAPVAPIAGLDGIERLVASVREAGVEVELTVSGDRRSVPSTVDLSAFRVLQEALTNGVRHGDRSAIAMLVNYRDGAVDLEVRNGFVAATPARTGGHGLDGMRERVAALGGQFRAGAEQAGTFVVRATIPFGRGSVG